MTVLYVAPHLDDVVFSCAGSVLEHRAAGTRVVVCTVFTHGTPAHHHRRREDREALRSIGAEHVHLGLDDAPVRERQPPSFRSLVLDAELKPRVIREVRGALRALLRDLSPDQLCLPLGVGGHIDHLSVFAARDAAGTIPTQFYEERPYAFVPALRTLRRLELEGGQLRRPPSTTALARQLHDGGCDALFAPDEKAACLTALAARLSQTHAGERLRLHATRRLYPAPARLAAFVDAYRSQVHWLLGPRSARGLWSRHAGARGGWYERIVTLRAY